ncbi:MAG: NAD-dependent DNA ligase LigA, partial [Lachnospiraceae bacterium]|nr:NAD-dependent DNA ligase LigA [Lachnospiraceae bacterium]
VNTSEQNLAGLTFVITGSLERYENRNALKAEIENRGGKVAGSVSAKTTALINNDAASNSSKNKTAKSLGVTIITEDDFINTYLKE